MNRSIKALAGAAVITAAAATTAVGFGSAAGAAAHCTAWADVPATFTITSQHAVLRPQLVGTAGCQAGSFDNGATADLQRPGQSHYAQRWSNFGAREQIDIYRSLNAPGTYTFTAGDVQVYDANEERIPSTWRTTSVLVRYGSRIDTVSRNGNSVHATVSQYSASGWRSAPATTVSLQQRSGAGWRTVSQARTSRTGAVTLTGAKSGSYRLVTSASRTVAGSSITR